MSLFKKDPLKRLQKAYEKKLLEVRDLQRAGNIQQLAVVTVESNELLNRIEILRAGGQSENSHAHK